MANLDKAREGKRKQEEFEQQKREAIEGLKGVGQMQSGYELKGVDTIKDNTVGAFGLKGVGDTGIKNVGPDENRRDVSTAWQQLHCANEISSYAFAAAGRGDIDETRYLASEAIDALNGNPIGVVCSAAPPMPKINHHTHLDPTSLVQRYQQALNISITQSEKIKAAQVALAKLNQKEADARAQAPEVPSSTNHSAKTEDEQIANAYREQTAFQAQEQKKIDEIIKKQKEKESAMEEALAALRQAQALLNSQNASQ